MADEEYAVDTRRDDRSRSPLPRRRSVPAPPPEDSEEAANTEGTNLWVANLSISVKEDDLSATFGAYGTVNKVQIIMDPHTRESRGFGFVEMANGPDADTAIEKLRGEDLQGRALIIEKAKRKKPRSATPGQYYGKEPSRAAPPRYDDRRRDDRYDDRRRSPDRYDDRRYDDRYSRRDDRYSDRYADRYTDRYDDRRRDDRYDDRRYDRRDDRDRGYDRRRDDRY